jgi:hypothetical protein
LSGLETPLVRPSVRIHRGVQNVDGCGDLLLYPVHGGRYDIEREDIRNQFNLCAENGNLFRFCGVGNLNNSVAHDREPVFSRLSKTDPLVQKPLESKRLRGKNDWASGEPTHTSTLAGKSAQRIFGERDGIDEKFFDVVHPSDAIQHARVRAKSVALSRREGELQRDQLAQVELALRRHYFEGHRLGLLHAQFLPVREICVLRQRIATKQEGDRRQQHL